MSQSGRRLALALMLGTALFVAVISPASSTQRKESALADAVLALVKVEPPRKAQEPAAETAEDDASAAEPLEPVTPAPRANAPRPAGETPVVPAARSTVRTSDAPAPRYHTVRMCVTAYCPCRVCCGRDAKGVTASGKSVRANGAKFVAADTRLLPFNTKVCIPGYNSGAPVPVLDTGRAIKGNRLDVFFPSHSMARKWGSRWLTCRVYDR